MLVAGDCLHANCPGVEPDGARRAQPAAAWPRTHCAWCQRKLNRRSVSGAKAGKPPGNAAVRVEITVLLAEKRAAKRRAGL